jgi:hypothetical protein
LRINNLIGETNLDVKQCKEAIRQLDVENLRRRADGLAELDKLGDFTDIEEPARSLLAEAYFCYTYIFYAGSILLSATALELTLKTALSKGNSEYGKHNLACLIDLAKEKGIITKKQAVQGHEIRKFRNAYVHQNAEQLGKMAGNDKIQMSPYEHADMWIMKEMVKQFQLDDATKQHALTCLTHAYEISNNVYINLHKNRRGRAS